MGANLSLRHENTRAAANGNAISKILIVVVIVILIRAISLFRRARFD